MVIAIDGHVGSGKSTLTKYLAEKLNFRTFNTGSMYRGIACEFINRGYKEEDISEEFMQKFSDSLNDLHIFFDDNNLQHVVVNGTDYTGSLRKEEISIMSAKVSPFSVIRERIVKIQREFAKNNDCIMEGRDIGTVVLPNADLKLFVTASKKVRAKRRFDQLKEQGKEVDYNEILIALEERDEKDEHREVSSLKPADDAVILDTSNQTLEETIDSCLEIINKIKKMN